MQDEIHDIENEPHGTLPWTAPSLVRLDAGDAEGGPGTIVDGFFAVS